MFKVIYIRNADPVFFTELDDRLQNCLRKLGVDVIQVELEDLYFEWEAGKISFYNKGELIDFDGVMNWGYMSPKHMQDFNYFIEAAESAGKVTLHSTNAEKILQSKLLQGLRFAKHGVPIPKSMAAFTVNTIKQTVRSNFTQQEKGVVKALDGYGGDGVQLARGQDEIISMASKEVWKNHQSVIQKFIPDSIGRSVRALCMNGQLILACEFSDTGSDFRSNNGYHESLKLVNKMDQFKRYEEVALKAVNAIEPNLTIGGVDILDSEVHGLQVLEVNGWSDLWDSERITGIDTFQKVADSYLARLKRHYHKE
ncbi:unnamed protein product [Paramecium octaurelia]|uniref:ATP-grasp domain-containing protein n=1 Tax=Paramecium octaurelia TaxID=43137 RepID=A0A8S1XK07_PAROT|nr:unnamed protein product [Paramecium octaurelia]